MVKDQTGHRLSQEQIADVSEKLRNTYFKKNSFAVEDIKKALDSLPFFAYDAGRWKETLDFAISQDAALSDYFQAKREERLEESVSEVKGIVSSENSIPAIDDSESVQVKPALTRLTDETIAQNQEALKNDVILPWMSRSPSYLEIFPKLFIQPVLFGEKVRGKFTLNKLLSQYKGKNIVITGEAGSGKSTLLRYLYLYKNENHDFLYLKAGVFRKIESHRTAYERGVLELLDGSVSCLDSKVILLDEMDEAFADTYEELETLLKYLQKKPEKIHIWFGWRWDHFNQMLTYDLQIFLDNILKIHKWDEHMSAEEGIEKQSSSMVFRYIRRYERKLKLYELGEQFVCLVKKNEQIYDLAKTPFYLAMILCLMENPEDRRVLENQNLNLYALYRQFFLCWFRKERRRRTSKLQLEEVRKALQKIAKTLYYGKECIVTSNDTAILDLLVFSDPSPQNAERIAVNFGHRSLCSYFYADWVFEAICKGGKDLIGAFDQPLRNDITDFVRAAINWVQDEADLSALQDNMIRLYFQAEQKEKRVIDEDSYELICSLSDQQIRYLQNELIYMVTRFPRQEAEVARFVEEAYNSTRDPFLRLDLAYGAVLTGPSWVGVDYAESLAPGSEEDIINRSWTVAYFGDVQANPYYFQDDGTCQWTKAREVRMKRFRSNAWKALRFRILDFPLMYCFYVSRGWADVNPAELDIIKQAVIDHSIYTEDEKEFLQRQKDKLVREYEKHLQFPN